MYLVKTWGRYLQGQGHDTGSTSQEINVHYSACTVIVHHTSIPPHSIPTELFVTKCWQTLCDDASSEARVANLKLACNKFGLLSSRSRSLWVLICPKHCPLSTQCLLNCFTHSEPNFTWLHTVKSIMVGMLHGKIGLLLSGSGSQREFSSTHSNCLLHDFISLYLYSCELLNFSGLLYKFMSLFLWTIELSLFAA